MGLPPVPKGCRPTLQGTGSQWGPGVHELVCEDVCEDWHRWHLVGEGGPLSLVPSVSGLSPEAWTHPCPASLRPCLGPFWLPFPTSCLPLSISPWPSTVCLTASICVSVSDTRLDYSLVCVCRHLSVSLWLRVHVWLWLLLDLGPTRLWGQGAAQAQVFPVSSRPL